jgi:hypothetical protein
MATNYALIQKFFIIVIFFGSWRFSLALSLSLSLSLSVSLDEESRNLESYMPVLSPLLLKRDKYIGEQNGAIRV